MKYHRRCFTILTIGLIMVCFAGFNQNLNKAKAIKVTTPVPVKSTKNIKLLVGAIKCENINLYSMGCVSQDDIALSHFILEIKGKSKIFNWDNVNNPLYYPKLLYKDINKDGKKELIVVNTIDKYSELKQVAHVINIFNFKEVPSKISLDCIFRRIRTVKPETSGQQSGIIRTAIQINPKALSVGSN